jgi:4-aminobutyrate aminotransferase
MQPLVRTGCLSRKVFAARYSHLRRGTASLASLEALGKTHVTKGLGRITDGIIKSGKGSYVEFHDGRKMLDFTCGIGVANLGT